MQTPTRLPHNIAIGRGRGGGGGVYSERIVCVVAVGCHEPHFLMTDCHPVPLQFEPCHLLRIVHRVMTQEHPRDRPAIDNYGRVPEMCFQGTLQHRRDKARERRCNGHTDKVDDRVVRVARRHRCDRQRGRVDVGPHHVGGGLVRSTRSVAVQLVTLASQQTRLGAGRPVAAAQAHNGVVQSKQTAAHAALEDHPLLQVRIGQSTDGQARIQKRRVTVLGTKFGNGTLNLVPIWYQPGV